MTKFTTERLDKLQDNLLQFQVHYSDPADKENYDIFVDALHMLDEFKEAKEKILAYEQAGNSPVSDEITIEELQYRIHAHENDLTQMWTADYFLNVQKELLALKQAAKNPICSFHISDGKVEATTDYCRDGEWPVQDGEVLVYAAPVLPKQPELIGMKVSIDTGSDNIGHRLFGEIVGTSESNGVPVLCIEVTENNVDVAAPAQPVIPEQQTVQLDPHVYRELVNDLRDVALEYHGSQQLRERISRALSKAVTAAHPHLEQPVSEPYKLPSGYTLVPVEPTAGMINVGISEAMKLSANVRMVYQAMLAAAPAQESE